MGSIQRHLRIGVDVGGTNTDAVVLDPSQATSPSRGVLAQHKTPTTSPNVTDGIETAVKTVLEESKIDRGSIACLTIGTTHFVNAIVENDSRRLSKVAIMRLSKSFTKEIPPFSDFPPPLKQIMNGYYCFVSGGLHIDGSEEAPIVEEEIVQQCHEIRNRGIDAVVISGVFSPIDEHFKQEHNVRKIIRRELPNVNVVCSSEVSNIGFLERENASILNASILKFARKTIKGFRAAMKRLDLHCALYLTQNDGTLIDAPSAASLPIRTFSSGPTNSMRGAAYLGLSDFSQSGKKTSTIVVDVGGTTTDVGVLLPSGFPRQASAYVEVAGVKINFSMPHVESIGLGGGSIVRESDAGVTVGPDSVGHYLTTKAKVFRGDVLTATDIAVAAGENIGDRELVKKLSQSTITQAQDRMKALLERVIDQMKTSPEPLPVLLVGGGSVICPTKISGVSEVIQPPFHSVANAVGAAISKIGGTVDMIQSTAEQTIAQITEKAKKMAAERAIAAGAKPETVVLAEVDAMPLQYVANQVRVIARAVGEFSPESFNSEAALSEFDAQDEEVYAEESAKQAQAPMIDPRPNVDVDTYRPNVVINTKTRHPEWFVSETDVEWMSEGCYVLGCAGGGSPFSEYIKLRDILRAGHTIRIIDSSAMKEDDVIYWGGHMGSPAVSNERLSANETEEAMRELMEYYKHDSFDVAMSLEIGGANGLQPLLVGSSKVFDRPTVDADWMGRAYPTYWQTTLCVYTSGELVPCAIASGDGKSILMTKTTNDEIVDRALRASCTEMGSRVGMAARPTTKEKVIKYSVLNTMSLAWRIGRCIARAKAHNTTSTISEQIIDEVGGPESAKVLFRGKIIGVERRLWKGHSYGEITIQQIADEEQESSDGVMKTVAVGGVLKIPFKNENIYAKHVRDDGSEKYIAMVPDLIAVLDTQSGKALGVPEYRYGVMVTVLGITCSPRWSDTPKGLEIGGPAAMGYKNVVYKPLGKYVEPKSVVLEYAPK
ncbi:putative Hydantoinase/oxoprolinase [Mollisia scopiformis]|uniref:Putative Hydantoinase/oxoprolinase n=1 Tax=Mollisia scopiformis TaxID=149040 RepID=A0A194XDE1_MOLSC|nr:putative Hydantoinase/oxoprolinase [Mollisia scopiformis]KUJ17772.1 putative Hydantoinase/oxoprolinase [Mollisia scopiformis]